MHQNIRSQQGHFRSLKKVLIISLDSKGIIENILNTIVELLER